MAASTDAINPSEIKTCPQCGTRWTRPDGKCMAHFLRQTYCSRACTKAANIKLHPEDDLNGLSFGRWTVTGFAGRSSSRSRWQWHCVCRCGSVRVIEQSALKAGQSMSCGCAQREAAARIAAATATHRLTNAPEYYVWKSMKQRCFNPKVRNYPAYGGRGVTVCERWRDSFEAFYADMGARPSDRYSIDRIDNDGNYEPGNCRWVALNKQVRNRRSNLIVEYQGRDMVLVDAAALAGVKYSTARARIRKGWAAERALTP